MMRRNTFVLLVMAGSLAGPAAFLPACGGDTPPAKSPQASAGDAGASATTSPSDVGTSDTIDPHSDATGDAKDAYDRGFKAWQAGDLPTAKQEFTSATRKDTKSASAHYSLGAVLERLGDVAGAQQEYRTAFTLKPDFEQAMGAYALSLANAGHVGEADTFLTDKHQKTPASARITTYLAEVKSIAKDSATAQQLAQDALRTDPDFKDAMVTIARDHYRARRTELAKYALQAILEGFGESSPARDKDNADAHLLRGLIEKEGGLRVAAMNDFDAARTKRPDMVEAVIQLGVMKLEAGNSQEAIPLLESGVRYAPNSALAHLNLGDAYRLAGRQADAKKEFDTALAQDSSLATAHYDLGLLYLFSPSISGTTASDQVATALRELNTYKTMRGGKAPGQSDDVDELIARATAKQADLKAGTAPAGGATAVDGGAGATKGGGAK